MATSAQQGRFVWHDLMTKDPEAAKRFYGELFGWRIWKGEHGDYLHVSVGERHIGGIMEEKHAPQSYWIGYLATDSVDDVVARAGAAGGRVYVPPTDIPRVGRFAVVADPRGAVTAPFASHEVQPDDPQRDRAPGEFVWDELLTDDPQATLAFYDKVWGWTHEAMEMPGLTYYIFKRDGVGLGGMMKQQPGMEAPPHWLAYVRVASADDTVARAQRLGAQVYVPAQDIPNVGRFAVFADPTGAAFAILQPAPRASQ